MHKLQELTLHSSKQESLFWDGKNVSHFPRKTQSLNLSFYLCLRYELPNFHFSLSVLLYLLLLLPCLSTESCFEQIESQIAHVWEQTFPNIPCNPGFSLANNSIPTHTNFLSLTVKGLWCIQFLIPPNLNLISPSLWTSPLIILWNIRK